MMPSMTPADHDNQTPQSDPTHAAPVHAIPFARPIAVEGAIEPIPFAAGEPPTDSQDAVWSPRMSRLRAIVELLVLVPAGVVGSLSAMASFSIMRLTDKRWYNVLDSIGTGTGTLLACAIMLLIARHKPAAIGWTRRNWLANAGLGTAALFCLYAAVFIPLNVSFPELAQQGQATQRAIEQAFPPMGIPGVVLMMTFVVLWEEVIFRGFVLTRLRVIFGRWWLAILVCSSVFGVIHYYEGALAVCMIAALALVMGTLFAWRRSLVPSMVLHWLFNVGNFLLLKTISTTWQ